MVGLGWMELMIIAIVGSFLLFGLIAVVIAVVISSRSRGGPWIPPVSGKATPIRALGPADKPIAESARWDGSELVVKSDQWSSKSLFDVTLPAVEQCVLTFRFRIMSNGLASSVYPEMWCRVPERGQFFSRGLHCKTRGTTDWRTVEIPFYLEKNQRADLLHLNLVFEGAGTVRLKDIEVLSTPA